MKSLRFFFKNLLDDSIPIETKIKVCSIADNCVSDLCGEDSNEFALLLHIYQYDLYKGDKNKFLYLTNKVIQRFMEKIREAIFNLTHAQIQYLYSIGVFDNYEDFERNYMEKIQLRLKAMPLNILLGEPTMTILKDIRDTCDDDQSSLLEKSLDIIESIFRDFFENIFHLAPPIHELLLTVDPRKYPTFEEKVAATFHRDPFPSKDLLFAKESKELNANLLIHSYYIGKITDQLSEIRTKSFVKNTLSHYPKEIIETQKRLYDGWEKFENKIQNNQLKEESKPVVDKISKKIISFKSEMRCLSYQQLKQLRIDLENGLKGDQLPEFIFNLENVKSIDAFKNFIVEIKENMRKTRSSDVSIVMDKNGMHAVSREEIIKKIMKSKVKQTHEKIEREEGKHPNKHTNISLECTKNSAVFKINSTSVPSSYTHAVRMVEDSVVPKQPISRKARKRIRNKTNKK